MNITKRDVQEIRRRLTKKGCTFSRVSGCYINSGRETVLKFTESFSDLAEEEFFKYLDIAKKVYSGSLGKNILELAFDRTEDAQERQQFLQAIKSTKLQNEELLDLFYDRIKEAYAAEGSILVLLFHDIYDVPVRTKDRQKLDESEEIYEYVVCAICPVELSKAALGYREEENRIGSRERDWVVGMPETGFVYPAFISRGTDLNAVQYYAKSDSHPELIGNFLGCTPCRTAAEEKQLFEDIVTEAFGNKEDEAEAAYLFIQNSLDGLVALREVTEEGSGDQALSAEDVADVVADVDMPAEVRQAITEGCIREFGSDFPAATHLLDTKLAEEGARRALVRSLEQKITALEEKLDEEYGKRQEGETTSEGETIAPVKPTIDLRMPKERRAQVRTEVVDGKKCLVIPLEEGETARINGDTLDGAPAAEENGDMAENPETIESAEIAPEPVVDGTETPETSAISEETEAPETPAIPEETAAEEAPF